MKKITIIHFNNIKKSFIKEGIDYYIKRLNNYYRLETYHEKKIKSINKYWLNKQRYYNIALSEHGKKINSFSFAKKIEELFTGNDYINFFIGSPTGLINDIEKNADMLLSFSEFTFTSDLTLLLLTEQLYRAAAINNNHPYHKN